MRLRHQSAIVTGAATGAGAAVARRLVAEGAQVWLLDADATALRRAADALGPAAHAWPAELGDAAALRALAEEVEHRTGRIDLLVHAARVAPLPQPLEGLHEAQFDRLVALSLKAVYLLAREFVPRWKAQRLATGASVTWINLVAPAEAGAGRVWFDAVQAALAAASAGMATELGAAGIRVLTADAAAQTPDSKDSGAREGAPSGGRPGPPRGHPADAHDALATAVVRLCSEVPGAQPAAGRPAGRPPPSAQRAPL